MTKKVNKLNTDAILDPAPRKEFGSGKMIPILRSGCRQYHMELSCHILLLFPLPLKKTCYSYLTTLRCSALAIRLLVAITNLQKKKISWKIELQRAHLPVTPQYQQHKIGAVIQNIGATERRRTLICEILFFVLVVPEPILKFNFYAQGLTYCTRAI